MMHLAQANNRKSNPNAMFRSPAEYQEDIRQLVADRVLPELKKHGLAIEDSYVEFANEFNYLKVSIARSRDFHPHQVLIEFGLNDDERKHHIGMFSAWWDISNQSIAGIDCILLRGTFCAITAFCAELSRYEDLPFAMCDGEDI